MIDEGLEFNRKNYIEMIKYFQMDNWRALSVKEKEFVMQWIVNYKASEFKMPSLCKVRIDNLPGNVDSGKFMSDTKELIIEKDLAVYLLNIPYHSKEKEESKLANKKVFEVLMHEFKHAKDQYILEHPELYVDDLEHKMLRLNDENVNGKDIRTYFITNGIGQQQAVSNLLYKIQPREREAFIYGQEECQKFNDEMHYLFPNDQSFIRYYPFSSFNNDIEDAKSVFETETPFEDIDDILRYLNGEEPLKSLNPIMLEAVVKTQTIEKSLVQKILDALKENIERVFGRNNIEMNNEKKIENRKEVAESHSLDDGQDFELH